MPSSTSASPAAWANILDTVDQALTLALVELAERQAALILPAPSAPPTITSASNIVPQARSASEESPSLALRACVYPSAPPTTSPWQQHLEQCDARLGQLQACVRQADAETADVDSALEAGEVVLRDWLAAAAVLIKGSDPADPAPQPGNV